MRREEATARGIQLPLLPTLVLGALPGGAGWGPRLARLGLDVLASGAVRDTLTTWSEARDAQPGRPCRAREPEDLGALVAADCRLIESVAAVPATAYRIGPDEAAVNVVSANDEVEDPNRTARQVVEAARAGDPAALWVTAGPGLEGLPVDRVEAKLRALVESAVRARMVLAKEQFDVTPGGERPQSAQTSPPGGQDGREGR